MAASATTRARSKMGKRSGGTCVMPRSKTMANKTRLQPPTVNQRAGGGTVPEKRPTVPLHGRPGDGAVATTAESFVLPAA